MFDITEQDCETITKLRWLQVRERFGVNYEQLNSLAKELVEDIIKYKLNTNK